MNYMLIHILKFLESLGENIVYCLQILFSNNDLVKNRV